MLSNKQKTKEIAKAIPLINRTENAIEKDALIASECQRIGVKEVLIRAILKYKTNDSN